MFSQASSVQSLKETDELCLEKRSTGNSCSLKFLIFDLIAYFACLQDEVELAKKDWELSHLQALKKEEEKRAAEEEDEILYTYSREEAFQVKKNKKSKHRSRPNSRCSSKKSSTSKETKKVDDPWLPSKEAPVAVRNSRSTSRASSRASSRSSSCSSSKRITRRTKLPDEI